MAIDQSRCADAVAVRAPLVEPAAAPSQTASARMLGNPWRSGSTAWAVDLMARGVLDPWEDLAAGTPLSTGVGKPLGRGITPVDTEGVVPQDPFDGVPEWVRRTTDPTDGPQGAEGSPDGPDWDLLDGPGPAHPEDPDRDRDWWRDGALLAATLAGLDPGPRLATVLAEVDPTRIDDAGVVDLAEAAARLAAWSHALLVRAAAELDTRASMNPRWPDHVGVPTHPGCAATELAMRLCVSRRAAQTLVTQGRLFASTLPATGDALAAGRIDAARARVLTDRLADQALDVAADVEDRVLPGAGRRTVVQLRRDVERALVEVDGAHAADRHRAARAGRRVCQPRVLPDGMAGLWAVMPAVDPLRVHQVLDQAARLDRSVGDPRTLDQLRTDHLCAAVLGEPPHLDDTTPTGAPSGAGAAFGACPSVVAADGSSGAGAAFGVYPSVVAADGSSGTGTAFGAGPCAVGAGAPSAGAGAAFGVPAGVPCEVVADGPSGVGVVSATPLSHRPSGTGGRRAARSRVDVRVVVAASTLLGLDDLPADLDGYGPIDAVQARALAAGGVWRRLVTDPLSGAVLDVGRTRYRPPTDLAEHVRERDQVCTRPGCSAPARTCDLDHTIEFHPTGRSQPPGKRPAPGQDEDRGGRTSADNLGPACRTDHLLKTHAGYRLSQPSPGVFEWTSPTGHRYRTIPGASGTSIHLGTDRGRSNNNDNSNDNSNDDGDGNGPEPHRWPGPHDEPTF